MQQVIIPAQPDPTHLSRACARLVGRDPDSLTATEERLAEYFGMYGELYWAEYARGRDYLYLRTDVGHPGEYIDIRMPPDTPIEEACWELAVVANHYLNTYLPDMLADQARRAR